MRIPRSKRTIAIAATALALVVGGGAAVAATQSSSDPRSAFLDSVAKHLGVTPQALKDATKAAAIEQVDAALAAGRITKEQADELKEHINAGDMPLLGLGVPGSVKPHGLGLALRAPVDKLAAAAKYLGLTVAQLRDQLRDGKSLADVAKARGKSVDGLEQAILADVKSKLDRAVNDKLLTDAQRDRILEHLQARIDDLVNGELRGPGGRRGSWHGPPLRPFGP